MTNDAITALEDELIRQNAALDDTKTGLMSLGDVEIHVPATFIEELDEIADRCAPRATETINGLRA